MKWIIIIVAAVVVVIVLMYLIGYLMPVGHQAFISVKIGARSGEVWDLITNPQRYQVWRKGLKNVIVTDSAHWTEVSGNGTIHYEGEVLKPKELFVSRIMNKDLPFGGAWTFELIPEGESTRLNITENGEVYNPIFRFLSKFVFGHQATLRQYAKDLGDHINKK